jgi:hypothetical protein
MDNTSLLITAMAEQCRATVMAWNGPEVELPVALHPRHLEWMCDRIRSHAEDWPLTKLHRWIGFVQCAMIANRMLDLDRAKLMFNTAKVAHGEIGDDLLDHLDPASSFELDIGGEG